MLHTLLTVVDSTDMKLYVGPIRTLKIDHFLETQILTKIQGSITDN